MQKNSSLLCLCYILRAIRAGRCREWRYADHIFIQIYFRVHHFVVKFSKFSSRQAARGIDPVTKILRTFLSRHGGSQNYWCARMKPCIQSRYNLAGIHAPRRNDVLILVMIGNEILGGWVSNSPYHRLSSWPYNIVALPSLWFASITNYTHWPPAIVKHITSSHGGVRVL